MVTEIFVFGANRSGIHGAGAAKTAHQRYGAKWGKGEGFYGQSYAIPTKDKRIRTLPFDEVKRHVNTFVEFASQKPEMTFYVTKIGCGLAGFKEENIAPLFVNCLLLENVKLPKDFLDILCKDGYSEDKVSFYW